MKLLLLPVALAASLIIWHRPTVIERTERSIVVVEFLNEEGNHFCTGFVVNAARGEVLTARHCVTDEVPITVDRAPSMVIRETDSLALVAIHPSLRMQKPPLEIRTSPTPVGEKVLTFGYGLGQMSVMGRMVAIEDSGDIGLDGPILPGMSGGPIVDLQGRVVGINQGTNATVSVACGQEEIALFLASK